MPGRASETYLKPTDFAAPLVSTIVGALTAELSNKLRAFLLCPQLNFLEPFGFQWTGRRAWFTFCCPYHDFFLGTFLPFFRAFESPIAIAWFRLLTLPPFPPRPLFAVPRL